MFLIYSVLNGVTLSTLGLAYGLDLVVIAFASTVVLFTVLAVSYTHLKHAVDNWLKNRLFLSEYLYKNALSLSVTYPY